jgi:hypothetical protein|tara:strand:- start:27 stop:476 length:450 start_codon:yes stop_codon:yes gene_type:complete
MKHLLFSVIIVVTAWGCGSSETTHEVSTEVPTEVPTELIENVDVQKYFETLDLFIDEFVTVSGKLIKAGQEVEESGGEIGLMDAFNMATSVASSAMTMAPLIEKLAELEEQSEMMQKELTGEELEEFQTTFINMMVRITEVTAELELLD